MSPERHRQRSLAELAVLATLLIGAVLVLDWTGWTWRLDNLVYDQLLNLAPAPASDDIVIVAIDEESLSALGRWPWPRRLHAEGIEALEEAGAKGVGLNIILAEPDFRDPEGDAMLAAKIASYGRVVLPVLPEATATAGPLRETEPIPILAASAAGLGHVDLEIEPDGVVRHVFLRGGLDAPRWQHFALALQQVVETGSARQASATPSKGTGAWVRSVRVGIPFAGPPGHFKRYSYIDLLRRDVGEDELRGRVVLIGVTAAGLGHPVQTPQTGKKQGMPGVEIVANVLAAARAGYFIEPFPNSWRILLGAALAVLPALFFPLVPTYRVFPVAVVLVILPVLIAAFLLVEVRLWYEPMATVVVLAASYPLWSWRALQRLAASLDAERSRAELTLQTLTEAVVIADGDGTVGYINPAAEQLTGWNAEDARGRRCEEVLDLFDEKHGTAIQPFRRAAGADQSVDTLPKYWQLTTREGHDRRVRGSIAPMANADSPAGAVITFADVTEERRLAQQIEYQATHDPLTGLPNRALLGDRLQQALARAERSGTHVAMLFADLDDFKRVNDGLGHAAGDALLREVGNRFKEHVRGEDSVARLGGDEFVVVIEHLEDEEEVTTVARKLIECVAAPFKVQDHETVMSASIGICFYPRDGGDIETLLRQADIAMYRAKEQGGNGFQYFRPEMNLQAQTRFTLENDLQRALALDQLRLHYQPVVSLGSGRIVGAEALLRWQHPSRGLVPPGEFIPIAERTGLIIPIGTWVLQTACDTLQRWRRISGAQLRMAVNLSPRQFQEPGLAETVAAALRHSGLPPDLLEVEITEDLLMSDIQGATTTLEALADMGVEVAIDDFGIGYSSLGYLKRFPVDRLKIDRVFVHDILEDADGAAIARAIVALGQSLRLNLTAEGIEAEEQVDFFRELGVKEAQGFLFHRPLNVDAFEALLESRDRSASDQPQSTNISDTGIPQ